MRKEIAHFHPPFSFYAPTMLRLLLVSCIAISVGVLTERNVDIKKSVKVLLVGAFAVFIGAMILGIVYKYIHKISVYEEGISSYDPNTSFKRKFMDWNSMKKAECKHLAGRMYITVSLDDKANRLWLPYSINGKLNMLHIISGYLGNDNELVRLMMSDV